MVVWEVQCSTQDRALLWSVGIQSCSGLHQYTCSERGALHLSVRSLARWERAEWKRGCELKARRPLQPRVGPAVAGHWVPQASGSSFFFLEWLCGCSHVFRVFACACRCVCTSLNANISVCRHVCNTYMYMCLYVHVLVCTCLDVCVCLPM